MAATALRYSLNGATVQPEAGSIIHQRAVDFTHGVKRPLTEPPRALITAPMQQRWAGTMARLERLVEGEQKRLHTTVDIRNHPIWSI